MIFCFVRCSSILYQSFLFCVSAHDCFVFVSEVWCGMCIDDGCGCLCMRWICIRLFIGIILCICLAVEGAGVMKGRRMEGISSSDH